MSVIRSELDENGNWVEKKITSEDVKFTISQFERQFAEIGKEIKTAVDRNRDLNLKLEMQKSKLVQLQVEDEENGVPQMPSDPLELIESDFPFFPDESECAFDDVTVIENPERCIEAMANFVSVIHANLHRFKHLPLGPLYCNMRVSSKRWTPLVEYVLRPYLFSFLVDNIVDELVMKELIEQHFPDGQPGTVNKHGVMVPKHFVFAFQNDYSIPSRISAVSNLEMDNMLEIINFDHENWGKFLSKTMNIEKILFMDNENVAFLLMSYVKDTPDVCRFAYTMDGFIIHPFPAFRTERIRFNPVSMYIKNLPSAKIGKTISKIKKLQDRITKLENHIKKRTRFQLLYARRIDNMKEMYKLALEIEEYERNHSGKEDFNHVMVSPPPFSETPSSFSPLSTPSHFSPVTDSWVREHLGDLNRSSSIGTSEEEAFLASHDLNL